MEQGNDGIDWNGPIQQRCGGRAICLEVLSESSFEEERVIVGVMNENGNWHVQRRCIDGRYWNEKGKYTPVDIIQSETPIPPLPDDVAGAVERVKNVYKRFDDDDLQAAKDLKLLAATIEPLLSERDSLLKQLEAVTARNLELQNLVLVPGEFKCRKCGFGLTTKSLNMGDGSVSMISEVNLCNNGCGIMDQVTEREWGLRMGERLEETWEELQELKAAEIERLDRAVLTPPNGEG